MEGGEGEDRGIYWGSWESTCVCVYIKASALFQYNFQLLTLSLSMFEIQFSTLYMFSNGVVRFWANSIYICNRISNMSN